MALIQFNAYELISYYISRGKS